ncbi:hypothetical protein MPH_14025 [Macrophomina phaseolina MS6]|uniref:Uncharacterized protein n=1 Tax=Macrophomina phaseolina (strain MS6) TaxID=1126212 RepID=K2RFZ4_MACPH|nr:hypothetical protein MPH_14025 [Macrophomina phaseolina MS6]
MPVRVHLSAIPAVVVGRCPESYAVEHTGNLACTMSLDISDSAAVMRLRAPLQLKNLPRQKPSLFAFISPDSLERIEEESRLPDNVTSALRSAAVGLRFQMRKPVVVVLPSTVPQGPLVPKNQEVGRVLSSIQSLAQITDFAVYFPSSKLSKSVLESICAIDWSQDWPAVPSSHDLKTLYSGQGARVVSVEELSLTASHEQTSPPSYDELALSSPPRQPSKKRRAERSPLRAPDDDRIREVAAHLFAECKESFRQEIQQELLSDVAFRERLANELRGTLREEMNEVAGQRMRQDKAQMEPLVKEIQENMKRTVDRSLHELKDNLLVELDERLNPVEEEIRTVGEYVHDGLFADVSDCVDVRLDDQMLSAKDELSSYVEDQIKQAEDRIRSDIDGMPFTLSL